MSDAESSEEETWNAENKMIGYEMFMTRVKKPKPSPYKNMKEVRYYISMLYFTPFRIVAWT